MLYEYFLRHLLCVKFWMTLSDLEYKNKRMFYNSV